MAAFRSFFANFQAALLLIFVYLGCIFFSPAAGSPRPQPKRRKISPLSNHQSQASSSHHKPHRSLSLSLRSYLRHLFSFSRPGRPTQPQQEQQIAALAPAQPHLHVHPVESDNSENRNPLKVISSSGSPAARVVPAVGIAVANVASGKRSSFPSRDDVFPCAACGEVFSKTHLLDLHQATRHAFSELADRDSGKNIVQIIFQSGWKGNGEAPVVRRVFKIHNSAKTVARFEEHRESVRSRAAARWAAGRGGGGEERCVADGNERLRFYCATFMCGLDREGNPGTCGSPVRDRAPRLLRQGRRRRRHPRHRLGRPRIAAGGAGARVRVHARPAGDAGVPGRGGARCPRKTRGLRRRRSGGRGRLRVRFGGGGWRRVGGGGGRAAGVQPAGGAAMLRDHIRCRVMNGVLSPTTAWIRRKPCFVWFSHRMLVQGMRTQQSKISNLVH